MSKCYTLKYRLIVVLVTVVGLAFDVGAGNKLNDSFFYNYTTEDGLPHALCECIAEDSYGFIWVGTPAGLVRFDGVFFEKFNDGNSILSENNVTALHHQNGRDTLWVGTLSGTLYSVRLKDNKFQPLLYDSRQINEAGIGAITSIFQLNSNILLLGTKRNGLVKLNLKTLKVEYINSVQIGDVKPLNVRNFRIVNGVVYMIAKEGIFTVRVTNGDNTELKLAPFSPANTSDILQIDQTKVLYIQGNTLYNYDLATGELTVEHEFPDTIINMVMDRTGGIWFSTYSNGMYYYDAHLNLYKHYVVGKSKYSLIDNNVTSVMRSQANDLVWITTRHGLVRVDNRYSSIRYYDLEASIKSKSANIFMINVDADDTYWLWSTDGLYFKHKEQVRFERVPSTPSYPNKDTIYQSINLVNGDMLFASTQGLLSYNRRKNDFRYLPLKNITYCSRVALISNTVYCVMSRNKFVVYNSETKSERVHRIDKYRNIRLQGFCREGDSLMWIGSNHGLFFKYDIRKDVVTDTFRIPGNSRLQSLSSIMALRVDKQRKMWIATDGSGLIKYDIEQNRFEVIKTSDSYTESIYNLEKDKNGNFWFTNSLGIVFLNPVTGQQKIYGKGYYILCPEYNQGASAVTPSGKIVMGGSGGFNEIDPTSISSPSVNVRPFITSATLFRTMSDYYNRDQQKNIYNPRDTIVIDEQYSSAYIYVRMLNFLNAKNSKIAWKIDNLDKEWRQATVATPIIYGSFPPGKHRMTILALDDDGSPMGEPLKILIIKRVYFYQHPLFKVFIVLVALGAIILYFVIRSKKLIKQGIILNEMVEEKTSELRHMNSDLMASKAQIERQKEELEMHRAYLEDLVKIRTHDLEQAKHKAEESDRLKTAFLANLSHEIRTPMNSIVGFSTLLSAGVFDEEEQKDFIGHIQASSESLLVLINDIVDISRIEANQLSVVKSSFDIEIELNQIIKGLQFEKSADNQSVGVSVDASCCNREVNTDKERFKQVVQNLVNNAVKFTPKNGSVEVSASIISSNRLSDFNYSGSYQGEASSLLVVSVADNGIGIAEENLEVIFEAFRKIESHDVLYPGVGLGLSIVRNIVKLLGGEIWVTSKLGAGSTFYFYIPVE